MVAHVSDNRIGTRYTLEGIIGEGGMGTVYRAIDRLTGRVVALKRVLAEFDEIQFDDSLQAIDFRMAMAQEFKLSSSLRHPNIITVLDYGFDQEQRPFYTMELVRDAATISNAAKQISLSERVTLLVQMLQALHYLHRRGIIHRDLKPANVLVANEEVKILDFGLSIMHERSHTDETDNATVGTLAYMAPEMLTGSSGTIQSDLYAVGMMAYEVLAGQHPFDLDNPARLVNQILMEVPNIDALDVSEELAVIIQRLLQKDTTDRYKTAQDVITALSNVRETPKVKLSEEIRDSFLQAARFVGRNQELNQLTEALDAVLKQVGTTWLIGGESGVGKSRIVEEIRTLAMVRGAVVMSGQAVHIGGTPYQLWQPILRWLPLLDDQLRDDDMALLKHFVPNIEQVLDTNQKILATSGTPDDLQTKLLILLEKVLQRINKPVLMIVEDLHWAGSESLSMLAHLAETNLPIMVIGTFRDDEVPDLHKQLPNMTLLQLRRLSVEGIRTLSTAMLGDTGSSNEVVDLLKRESEGNIFFIIEVVRALAEEVGNLEDVGRMTLPAQVFAGGIRTVISRRLERISAQSRHILRYAAVMGRELNVAVLQALMPHRNFEAWLAQCANAAVLQPRENDWVFAHDKLRLGLLETLDDTEQKAINREVAATIEVVHTSNPQYYTSLAYHWGNAGEKSREEYYVTQSGSQALKNGAYKEAIKYFKRAQKLLNNLDIQHTNKRHKQIWLRQQIADAHLGTGDYKTAAQLHNEALILGKQSGDKNATAQSLEVLGTISLVQDKVDIAQAYYSNSLEIYRELGRQEDVARLLNRLGDVAYEIGQAENAKHYYQESIALSREIGKDWGMAGALRQTQETPSLRDSNNASQSIEDMQKQLQTAYEAENINTTIEHLLTLAKLYKDSNSTDKSVRLLAYLLSDTQVDDNIQDEAESVIFQIEAANPTYSIHTAWETGKSYTLTNAVTTALES